jgi:hypothetical protein
MMRKWHGILSTGIVAVAEVSHPDRLAVMVRHLRRP